MHCKEFPSLLPGLDKAHSYVPLICIGIGREVLATLEGLLPLQLMAPHLDLTNVFLDSDGSVVLSGVDDFVEIPNYQSIVPRQASRYAPELLDHTLPFHPFFTT